MKRGFTLIELVIVIVILGILAAIALPKFVDLVTDAKISATKAGLGAIRSVVALKYSKNLAAGTPGPNNNYYPSSIDAVDFFDGKLPENKFLAGPVIDNGIQILKAPPASEFATQPADGIGWWYIPAGTGITDPNLGKSGAYSDGKQDTSLW